jgi:hypothetical protein
MMFPILKKNGRLGTGIQEALHFVEERGTDSRDEIAKETGF